MDKKKFVLYNFIGCIAWVFSMLFGGHYLQQFCLAKLHFDLKEHLEVIVIGIVVVTTAPVLYKLFFGRRTSLPAAAKEDPFKKSIVRMEKKNHPLFNLAVIVGALGYFVDIYDLLLFSIIRIPSLKGLGLSADEIKVKGGDILNIQMIGLLIGGIIWGVMGDKLGRLRVLFASIILYSLGSIANGMVHTLGQYELARFVTGLGLAGELGAGITLVSELMPKERRGIATSWVAGIGLSGAVFAYYVKQWFGGGVDGWRTCFYIGGGLGFLLLLLRGRRAGVGDVQENGGHEGEPGQFLYVVYELGSDLKNISRRS